jgi:hypothetical protein
MRTKALDPTAQMWKDAYLTAIEAIPAGAALFLSGGVDSASILAGLVELGRTPKCYGYRIGDRDSADSAMAAHMCRDEGLDFDLTEFPSPTHVDWWVRDVREIIELTGKSRKTILQCAQPMRQMAAAVKRDGHSDAILGTGAVVLDDRTVMVKLHQEGEAAATEYRREKLNDRYGDCGTSAMHDMITHFGMGSHEPLSDEPLKSVALGLTIGELAKGPNGKNIQKGIAMRAFPWFFQRPGYWRHNVSLQVGSGLREVHDQVFLAPAQNPWGYKRVIGVYGKMLEDIQSQQGRLVS